MIPSAHFLIPAPGAHPPITSSSIRLLARLPYDIQEDITHYLSTHDLHALSLSSKYLSALAARAMYTIVHLHSSSPTTTKARKLNLRPLDVLRLRQFSFFVAIAQHPEYTRFIRHISFEFTDNRGPQRTSDYLIPTDLVWKAFAKCKAVTSIHITMAHDGEQRHAPLKDLFPNLVHATVEGAFPQYTLDRLLSSGARLRTLEIKAGTAEIVPVQRGTHRTAFVQENLSDFLARATSQGAFEQLRSLEVTHEKEGDAGLGGRAALLKLPEAVREQLEELTVHVPEGDENWWKEWGPSLKKVEWKTLKRVRIPGVRVTRAMAEEMPGMLEESTQ